jgi:hypothetical protein
VPQNDRVKNAGANLRIYNPDQQAKITPAVQAKIEMHPLTSRF